MERVFISNIAESSITTTHAQFFSRLLKLIDDAEIIVITAHINVDVDALASAVGLKNLLDQLYMGKKNFNIVLPQFTRLAEKVKIENVPYEIPQQWPEHIDLCIIVDTTDPLMTEIPYDENTQTFTIDAQKLVVIDHHLPPRSRRILSNLIVDEHILPEYSSATEIITEFFRYKEIIPEEAIAVILLMGILTDTGNFRYANVKTMDNGKYLLETGISLRDTIEKLNVPMERPEKIARLRAAMRMEDLTYINNWVVAVSHVSTYEASACKALVNLGASVAFVVAFDKRSNNFRISSRAGDDVIQKTHLHLGKIMEEIGNMFNGSGGGHDGAAGCYGKTQKKNDLEEIAKIISKLIKPILQDSQSG